MRSPGAAVRRKLRKQAVHSCLKWLRYVGSFPAVRAIRTCVAISRKLLSQCRRFAWRIDAPTSCHVQAQYEAVRELLRCGARRKLHAIETGALNRLETFPKTTLMWAG